MDGFKFPWHAKELIYLSWYYF